MRRPHRPRWPVLVTICSLLVVAGALGAYAWSGSHSIAPGMRGCAAMRDTTAQSKCISSELRGVMDDAESVEAGLVEIDRRAEDDALIATHCHLAMHRVAETDGARLAKREERPKPFRGGSSCRTGYVHGVMLGFVAHTTGGALDRVLRGICDPQSTGEQACAHVAGHVIARDGRGRGFSGRERAVDSRCNVRVLRRAIGDDHPTNAQDVDACVRGGMMEIAIMDHQPPLPTWRRRCERAPVRLQRECFRWLIAIAAYRRLDFDDALAACGDVSGRELRRTCRTAVAPAASPT